MIDNGKVIIEDAEANAYIMCSQCNEYIRRCDKCGGMLVIDDGCGSVICHRVIYSKVFLNKYAHYCRDCDPRKQVDKR